MLCTRYEQDIRFVEEGLVKLSRQSCLFILLAAASMEKNSSVYQTSIVRRLISWPFLEIPRAQYSFI